VSGTAAQHLVVIELGLLLDDLPPQGLGSWCS
jgi:hypothetical protein